MAVQSSAARQLRQRPVNPWEVSLYNQQLNRPAAEHNPAAAQSILPWMPQSDAAGMLAAEELGRPDGGLYGQLERQASEDLALGGQLSNDEIRESAQGARAAWQARGLGTSAPASFQEVLNRVQFSNARKAERQTFAAGIENLGQQRRASYAGILGMLSAQNSGIHDQAEGIRQFDIERDDTLRFNDKSIAANVYTGNANAAAGKSAAKAQTTAAAIGAVATIAVAL